MAWIRSGECNRCGVCCKGCNLFSVLPDGRGHCTDRLSKLYLSGCDVWPDHPRIPALYKTCSYSFEWKNDEDIPVNPYSWDGWDSEFERFGLKPPEGRTVGN